MVYYPHVGWMTGAHHTFMGANRGRVKPMVNEIGTIEEPTESPEPSNPLLAGLRRILMAGIGVVVLTQEQIEDFVNRLVERGEIADGDARNLVSEINDRRKRLIHETTKKAEGGIDKQIENMLSRMNIPTKSEIESLSEKIADLSRKVDEINWKN
jgi:poly(hydroxyalkanoate) granule-associated protein